MGLNLQKLEIDSGDFFSPTPNLAAMDSDKSSIWVILTGDWYQQRAQAATPWSSNKQGNRDQRTILICQDNNFNFAIIWVEM